MILTIMIVITIMNFIISSEHYASTQPSTQPSTPYLREDAEAGDLNAGIARQRIALHGCQQRRNDAAADTSAERSDVQSTQ